MKRLRYAAILLWGVAQAQETAPPPSPMETVNRQLPKWLRFGLEERLREESYAGLLFKPGNEDTYVLSRFRGGITIAPLPWLKVTAQGQDSRVFWKTQKPYAPPLQDTWDLRLAYLELGISAPAKDKNAGYVRVGRQEINLGDERLVGSSQWLNTPRSFDAVRAGYRRGKYRIDAFASAVVILKDGELGNAGAGNNLHGLVGGLDNVIPKSTLEPYVLWRLQPRVKAELGPLGNLSSFTSGVRFAGQLPSHFDYSLEMAMQRGSVGPDDIKAWAGHWGIGYTVAGFATKPRLVFEYNHASGDGNAKDGHRNTFDQLYPSGHDKYGLSDQIGWKNIHHLRMGAEWKISPKLGLSSKFNEYWLADAHDGLYNTASTLLLKKADGAAGAYVGAGLDGSALYSITKQVGIGAGVTHIFPGEFLKKATAPAPIRSYTGQYLFLETKF